MSRGSLATVAFVGLAAGIGGYLWMRPTIISGEVAAARLLERAQSLGVERVTCDPGARVTPDGATLGCTLFHVTGRAERVTIRFDADGKIRSAAARGAPAP